MKKAVKKSKRAVKGNRRSGNKSLARVTKAIRVARVTREREIAALRLRVLQLEESCRAKDQAVLDREEKMAENAALQEGRLQVFERFGVPRDIRDRLLVPARIEANPRKCAELLKEVDRISHDQGLWFVPTLAPEAYLQEALRKLVSVVNDAVRFQTGA